MDFISAKELLTLCQTHHSSISNIMLQREIQVGEMPKDIVIDKLNIALDIMKNASHAPLTSPQKSIGGLLGGEAKNLHEHSTQTSPLCGATLSKALAYSIAVLEMNATMGLIVAAPTAGSSGVIPGVLLATQEDYNLSKDKLISGLLNTSAIGYIIMRNASVSGAEAGCQAEVGSASAMAASALVELLGGTPDMCLQAASLALSNLLGLVCDPIAGLVESPCQSRNAIGVSNAFTCAQLALSGITHPIPFDEMVEAMYRVGRALPFELRETAMGGNAATPTGCALACDSCNK